MPVETRMRVAVNAVQTGSNDFGGPTFSPSLALEAFLADGVLAGTADQIFFDERSVTTGANDDLDLAGVLTNAFGTAMTMAKIVAIFVINAPKAAGAAANTTNLTIGAGTNPLVGYLGGTTPTIGPIRPGGFVALGCAANVAGLCSVTAGTGDILRIANSAGATAVYQIAIVARSA